MDTFLFEMSMKWMFTFKNFRNVYWHGTQHSALRSSKITVNQASACTELIFITTVANLRNCCILLCSYCVVLLAKQQGINVNWLWKQMVLIYLIGHLPNFVTNLRALQITYFLRVKSFTRNLRSSKTRQILCQAM